MAKLEEENKKLIRRTKLQEAILITIASGGRLGSSALVPEVLNSLLKTDLPSSVRKGEMVRSTASRLAKQGLLKLENNHYVMTATGDKILEHWKHADFRIVRPKRWDQKWRIVIFDIPERKKVVRDEIREILTAAGFRRLQDSVWVCPYDCEGIIGLLKTDYGIGKEMLYIIADQIESDKYLRMDFDLISYT